ncbi:hypothetical protein JOH51_001669 [Rhizobium leguminosarum]|nr:hypothetical protein [Rhizobium leguminosarum]
MDEVQRPAGIGLRLNQDRRTRADRTPPGFALANRKSFLAIEPVDAIDAGRLSLPPKQNEQSPVSETPSLVGEVAQLRPQFYLRRAAGPISHHLPIRRYNLAGPPFRKTHDGLQMRDGVAFGGKPYH